LELQGLGFPNFDTELWSNERISPPCVQISLSFVLKFGNPKDFIFFMHEK
jgi:hypothetical protein